MSRPSLTSATRARSQTVEQLQLSRSFSAASKGFGFDVVPALKGGMRLAGEQQGRKQQRHADIRVMGDPFPLIS